MLPAMPVNRLTGSLPVSSGWEPGEACYQGRVAGMNKAGVITRYAGSIPQHVSPIFSWTYMQIGDALRKGPSVRYEEKGGPFTGSYRITIFDNEILAGANLINNAKDLIWIKKEMNMALSAA